MGMNKQIRIRSLHGIILGAWECAFGDSPVVYLSGPLTTGLAYVERVRAGGMDSEVKRQILRDNSEALISMAKALRTRRGDTIVEPATLSVEHWSQSDYLELWERFIEQHARLIVFMPGWEYSIGCATEFARAIVHDVRTETVSGSPITIEDGIALLTAARDDLRADDAGRALYDLASRLSEVIARLKGMLQPGKAQPEALRKDASLNYLADHGFNVAQFISFAPSRAGPKQEYARIAGQEPNVSFRSVKRAIEALLQSSPDKSVNVRSYEPYNPMSREFIYGIRTADEAAAAVERLTSEGLHTIVNETVDIHDGGASGVLMGNVLEFSPDDTPRCVEKPGTASLPRGWGRELLSSVYRFPVELAVPFASRLEFSLHPRLRGWKQTNILVWEFSERPHVEAKPRLEWPNNFSRLIGDKVFGLLVGHHIGLPVPLTTVINRRVAPFSFGRPTGWGETWIRTSPIEQMPGKFPTYSAWVDPYALIREDDDNEPTIASVLSQEGIRPFYSGALIVGASGEIILEGKSGEGESFMQGECAPEALPEEIEADVRDLFVHAEAALGAVRFEWVHDGNRAWIVQLHRGATETDLTRITQGEAERWVCFDVRQGLEVLRSQIADMAPGAGLILKGKVGLTSHIADVIRKAQIPARMEA